MPLNVDAILMASGYSVRFGSEDKLLAPFQGLPLAGHTLRLVTCSELYRNIFFVWASPEVARLAEGYKVQPIHNENPTRGLCESVRLGTLVSKADYYHYFPCDQPLLNDDALKAILAAARPGGIAVPYFGERRGSPVLFSSAFREELLAIPDHEMPRVLLDRHPKAVTRVPLPAELLLADVDTAAQLGALEKKPPN